MPADYDGDGRMDLAVFRPSTGQWFVLYSSTGGTATSSWGVSWISRSRTTSTATAGPILAVYRASSGQWFVLLSTTRSADASSARGACPAICRMQGDFDGDGRSEISASTSVDGRVGRHRRVDRRPRSQVNRQWGLNGDIPVPHDYDGDGVIDHGVFRPAAASGFIRLSSTGGLLNCSGVSSDTPR
jgi:hypothetical protein